MLWWLGDGFLEILMERSSKALVPQLGIFLCMSTLQRWLREQSWWDLRLETKWCAASLSHSQRVGLWVCQCGCWKKAIARHEGQLDGELGMIGTTFETTWWFQNSSSMWPARRASSEAAASSLSIPKPHDQRDEIAAGLSPGRLWQGRIREDAERWDFWSQKYFLGSAEKNGGNFCTWSCFSFSCRSTVKSWQLFADYFCWTLCCIILLDCRASLFGDDSDDDLFSSKK